MWNPSACLPASGEAGALAMPECESTVLGSQPVVDQVHMHPLPHRGQPHAYYDLAKPSNKVRYLCVPYAYGTKGEGPPKRPTSAAAMSQYSSEREKAILAQGAALLQQRANATAQAGVDRVRAIMRPMSAGPAPYMTTTKASYAPRPAADSQQQRVRKHVSAGLASAAGGSLDGAPIHVEAAPLEGGSALHAQRYLGVGDADGTRRLLEIDTTGGPVLTLPPPYERSYTTSATAFVPSQPSTRNIDEDMNVIEGERLDPRQTPLPRRPWPTGAPSHPIVRHQRRPFACDFTTLGEPLQRDYKIASTKAQAAAAKDLWSAQVTAMKR